MGKFINTWQEVRIGVILSLLFLAQVTAMAQSSPGQLNSLLIQLWPEYDRSETLVIYHVELPASISLPAQLSFRLPGYLKEMHVVAVEREGILVEVNPNAVELTKEGENLWLSFSTPVPRVQFEYYDPVILTKEGQKRQLNFNFVAAYNVEKATVQIQEPFQAENFSMTPAPSAAFTGNDGLQYNTLDIAGLAADEVLTITASYTRSNNELSAQNLGGQNAELAPNPVLTGEAPPGENLALGYGLIGIGVALLLGVIGYWWWSRQSKPGFPAAQQRQRRKRKGGSARPIRVTPEAEQPAAPGGSAGNFCFRCGAALREEANFCHICGAERRKE